MIVDGKSIAETILSDLAPKFKALSHPAHLGIYVARHDPVIESFVRIKSKVAENLGIEIKRVDASESDIARAAEDVRKLAADTDAVIVQLPLPSGWSTDELLAAIPKEKDVDALNPAVFEVDRLVHAPVALAVVEILRRSGIETAGKKAVIVGAGRLVGKPTGELLKERGAAVSFFTLEEGSIEDLKDADIVVCGAGKPGFIKPEHVKEGAVLIDAGASEDEGVVRGDLDPACAEKAAVFTPVPGGVGPIAVAMIFRNLLDLLKNA